MEKSMEYIRLTDAWNKAEKGVIIDNLERIVGYPVRGNKGDYRINQLVKITGVSKHTVIAWMNRSRSNVKPPLYHLCMIAEYYSLDIDILLTGKIDIRDWNVFDISDNQQRIFSIVRECDYYDNGVWNYSGIARRIAFELSENNLSVSDNLLDYCTTYIMCIIGVQMGTFVSDMRSAVEDYLGEI